MCLAWSLSCMERRWNISLIFNLKFIPKSMWHKIHHNKWLICKSGIERHDVTTRETGMKSLNTRHFRCSFCGVQYRKPSAESVGLCRSCTPFQLRIQQMSEVRWQACTEDEYDKTEAEDNKRLCSILYTPLS